MSTDNNPDISRLPMHPAVSHVKLSTLTVPSKSWVPVPSTFMVPSTIRLSSPGSPVPPTCTPPRTSA
nr:hypothetical protein [Nanoarchaeota archaeon]